VILLKFFDYLHREYRECIDCKCYLENPDLSKDCIYCTKICGCCPPVECFVNNCINKKDVEYAYNELYKEYGECESSKKLVNISINNVIEKRKLDES
jgi:hypothetical protein